MQTCYKTRQITTRYTASILTEKETLNIILNIYILNF